MSDKIQTLADALPAGLNEEVVEEIAGLLQDIITERVEEEVGKLNNKVHAFLRQQMDMIQEAAMNELHETSDVYRDAELLSNIKAVMAFEVDREDVQQVAATVNEEVEKVQESNEMLVAELAQVLKEKEQAERAIEVLTNKNTTLSEQTETLQEQYTELEAKLDSGFESSEKAIVITEEEDTQESETPELPGNPFLTNDVLSLLPNNSNGEF